MRLRGGQGSQSGAQIIDGDQRISPRRGQPLGEGGFARERGPPRTITSDAAIIAPPTGRWLVLRPSARWLVASPRLPAPWNARAAWHAVAKIRGISGQS
jgi:hypothetical protein